MDNGTDACRRDDAGDVALCLCFMRGKSYGLNDAQALRFARIQSAKAPTELAPLLRVVAA